MADLKRKLGEHERLMTWVLLVGIFVDAYFDLGIDWQHWAMALGLQGSFNISRGIAKRGAGKLTAIAERVGDLSRVTVAEGEGK